MKLNLFWGLIDFEADDDAVIVTAIVIGVVLAVSAIAYFISYNNVTLYPEHVNCLKYEIDHPSQYGGC